MLSLKLFIIITQIKAKLIQDNVKPERNKTYICL